MLFNPEPIKLGEILTLEGDDVPGGTRQLSEQEITAAITESRNLVELLSDIDSGLAHIPIEQFVRFPAALKEALHLYRCVKESARRNRARA